jgi:hypothetical protein
LHASTSTRLTHSSKVCAEQPILGAIQAPATHWDGYSPRCACTTQTARSRTSGEYFGDFFMAPPSWGLEPPQNPGQFNPSAKGGGRIHNLAVALSRRRIDMQPRRDLAGRVEVQDFLRSIRCVRNG